MDRRSIFVIGMRGAGKTTAGRWIAHLLQWQFVDLDDELEHRFGKAIPEIIRGPDGWDGFRQGELKILSDVMKNCQHGYVFSCGGGIVESSEARAMLQAYCASGGVVVLVHRNTDQVLEYLMQDKTRPAYTTNIREVYERRKSWYEMCSNYSYYSPHTVAISRGILIPEDFRQFIACISGNADHLQLVTKKRDSCFVSLTVPRIYQNSSMIQRVVVGSDAVELRADLLEDWSHDSITEQVSLLRFLSNLPIIFTVRTISQGGRFPDDDANKRRGLYRLALKLGVEYLDVEITSSDEILLEMTSHQRHTRIITSHHDPTGTLSWKNASWIPFYNRALQYGDVIKLIGLANTIEDNFELERFRNKLLVSRNTPIIAINMGEAGKLSRIMNNFLTPVSHPDLPFKAAPGQMSAFEIRHGRALIGKIKAAKFYLFGSPIAQSRSPALHNTLFMLAGLPHTYNRHETSCVENLPALLQSEEFGGASVTIPLKQDIIPLLHGLTPAAKLIGAVNTIVVQSNSQETNGQYLVGDNTDWKGMVFALKEAGILGSTGSESAAVVGSGGTARSAVYALKSMGFSPIFVVGRDADKVKIMSSAFPVDFNIISVPTLEQVQDVPLSPSVMISTIPADRPIDDRVQSIVSAMASSEAVGGGTRALLEMAYKPRHTQLMKIVEDVGGWITIPGLEVLASQGWYQFEAWTGVRHLYQHARDAVNGAGGDPRQE